MAEPFKLLLDAALVRRGAAHLARVDPAFDVAAFVAHATCGLDLLEMKARAMRIADALEATLPPRFADAAALLTAAMATPREPGQPWADDGLAGWFLWPVGEFVARRGIGEPARALAVLHALTQRFSAEFAIRPFIVRHPQAVFATLARWTTDPSAHVRRLVSEGSRPRLPWGQRLQALVADPAPTLPLLQALQDDASAYVRRSVANHLNDIAKDHPGLLADWVDRHLPGADAPRRALLRHASRTLIKSGDRRVLQAWGLGKPFDGRLRLAAAPRRPAIGGALTIEVRLESTAARAQRIAVDYAVHHVKADGRLSPKVFKGWVVELAPGQARTLTRRHSLRPVTTRSYHAGRHLLDLRLNGQVRAETHFDLQPARQPG